MAAHEQLILDILANTTQAERGIGSLSRTIGAADDDVMGLAKRLDELGRKSASARVKLEGNTEAQAQLDKLDAKMLMVGRRVMDPKIKVDGTARAAAELAGLDAQLDTIGGRGGSAEKAAGGLAALVGGAGAPTGQAGITGLIAAGAALSPVIATLGTGLGGLGLAAYGVSKNTALMGQVLKPLKTEFAGFTSSLQPEVLGAFNEGVRIAGHLLHDIEPVAAATGKAFGGFLGQVDREFQSGTWQQFFGFMARTAAPDMKLLGNLTVDLLDDIPSLVQSFQPLAVAMLRTADGAAKLLGWVGKLHLAVPLLGAAVGFMAAGPLGALAGAAIGGGFALAGLGKKASDVKPVFESTGHALVQVNGAVARFGTSAGEVAKPIASAGNASHAAASKFAAQAQAAKNAAQQLQQLIAVTDKYVTNTSSMLGVTNSVITDIRQMAKDSRAAGASFTGLNANSIILQNDLSQNLIPTVETVIKRMQGAGANSHDLAKVLSTDLKPAVDAGALANRDLRDEIFAMAREAGYAGPNRIAPLSRFIDRNAGSLRGARNDANSYTRALKGIPGDISTHIRVTAQAQIAVSTGVQRQIPGRRAARGMLITAGTTPTADDVLIRASRGELVVPANMVRAGAVDHLKGSIPGFASGGMVGRSMPAASALRELTAWVGSAEKQISGAISRAVGAAVKSAIAAARQAAAAAGAPGAMGGPASAGAAAAQAYARSRLGAYGWDASQMPPLIALWNQESGWNRFARNPSSGAYGIPQALPPGKMGAAANPPTSSAAAQVNWGLGYIRGRYGSPAGAEAHERAFNWYDDGGWLPPGPSLAVNNTGQPERVLKPGQPPSVALTQNGDVYIRDPVDWNIVSGKLSFAVTASGFG